MTVKGVTSRQTDHIRVMANAKGISRELFQEGLDRGVMSTALDAIKTGGRIKILPKVLPPEGGRIHTIGIAFKLDREWQEAVSAAGHDTPDDYNVRRVGNLYLPAGMGIAETEMILVNFGPAGGSFDEAVKWAEHYSLKRTCPRRVFAIAEHKPKLHRTLGMNSMYVVATQVCFFEGEVQACCVWWDEAEREADLHWLGHFGNADDWFAFASG